MQQTKLTMFYIEAHSPFVIKNEFKSESWTESGQARAADVPSVAVREVSQHV